MRPEPILISEFLRLRAVEPADLEVLYTWENDTEIWYLSNTLIPFSKYTLKQYIKAASKDIYETKQLRLIIEVLDEKRAVGAIDLFDFDPFNLRAGVGILVHDKQDRKKGIATQALSTLTTYARDVLGLKQLYCNITENNEDSLKLFIKQGFVITGQKKEWTRTLDGWLTEFFLQKLLF
jgi:diamine N-acetyltransferase